MTDPLHHPLYFSDKPIRKKSIYCKHDIAKRNRSLILASRRRQTLFNPILHGGSDSLIHVPAYFHRPPSVTSETPQKKRDVVTINVSGSRYQTRLSTLANYPNTLLGDAKRRTFYWNEETNEYFFDRPRACFEAILYYYQSNGRLRRPDYVALDTFLEEVSFFDLGPHAFSQINRVENVSIVKYVHLPSAMWRRYIWFYLEYPQHSVFARCLHFVSLILTVLSCVEVAVETLPEYDDKWNQLCGERDNQTFSGGDIPLCAQMFSSPFYIIQGICVAYFTIEFLLRLISTPSYYRFVLSLLNWIDLGAILPYFVFLGLALSHHSTDVDGYKLVGLRIFRILRFIRVFKVYLIFNQLKSLRVLSATLKESFWDFLVLIVILTLMGFLFGAGVYFAEQDENGAMFDSIPKATYWGIITISTVGYGDMFPVTIIGRCLACVCALFGVATSGMLVSVLVDRYQRVYNRKKFFPEQIFSAVDSSASEQDEKQSFLNKRMNGSRRTLATLMLPTRLSNVSIEPVNDHQRYLGSLIPSARIQFVLSIEEEQAEGKSSSTECARRLMEELAEIIDRHGEPVALKWIPPLVGSPAARVSEQLSRISEE